MKPFRSLLGQYVAFLALVVAALSLATFIRTTETTRHGLENLFRQRFVQAGQVLQEHAIARSLTRWTELESVLRSPRFLAALETGDPATLEGILPSHPLLQDAEVLRITNAAGATLFQTPGIPASLRIRMDESRAADPEAERRRVVAGSSIYEILTMDVRANNGTWLGRLEVGEDLGLTLAGELRRLTGFEVAIVLDGQVVDCTGDVVLAHADAGELADLAALPVAQVLRRDVAGHRTLALRQDDPTTNVTVLFLGSLDEAIAPVMSGVRRSMLTLSVVAGVIAMTVIAVFTHRRVGKQVGRLVRHAERIARGDLDFEIRAESSDELGYLSGELEKMRAELLRSRREVEDAHAARIDGERMAVVGQMATGIVHDLKNPMAVVQGTVDLIHARDPDNPKLARQCGVIHRQVERMVALTRDVLEYARGDSRLEPEVVDLAEWIAAIRTLHEEAFRRSGVRLSVEPGDAVGVLMDPSRMQRVVDNLITNAREFSHVGDIVTVSWWRDERGVHLQVSDVGPGIPAELVDKVFDPFVTSGKEGGSGLGLAIARKIVEDHGASIRARSAPGSGTDFTVTLPAKLVSQPSAQPEGTPS